MANCPPNCELVPQLASFGEDQATRQLDIAVNWGRYTELYGYDASRGQITREDHGIGATLGDLPEPVRRGALHLYLGAAPGSGKTFTMLRMPRRTCCPCRG